MLILVDMDNVIAEHDKGFMKKYYELYPEIPKIQFEERNTFYLDHQFDQKHVFEILFSKGFFKNLEPVAGSIVAIKELKKENDVYICTCPTYNYQFCLNEKLEWIEKELGHEWTRKVIFTHDKTLVHGDLIIDDNPEIKGISKASWEHVIFEQPYNKHIKNKKKINWQNWKTILNNIV